MKGPLARALLLVCVLSAHHSCVPCVAYGYITPVSCNRRQKGGAQEVPRYVRMHINPKSISDF